MWKQSSEFREQFNSADDASVAFSVDPDMYEKLGIKKPKKGEENQSDLEKIYRYQLEKDLKKMVERKGTYKSRADKFTRIRESDPEYRHIAIAPTFGAEGNFIDINAQTKLHSWQSTSKPYGVIAHKRYLEYLANLPKGPTKDEVQDKLQRHMDRELWEKVVEGRLDPTKRDLKRRQQELIIKQKKLMGEWEEEEEIVLDKEQLRKKAFLENNFSGMRALPTEREFIRSTSDWHRGIHYPFDTDKGFPVLVRRNIHSVRHEDKNVVQDSKRPKSAPITSERFIAGSYGQEKQYAEFLAQKNFDRAESYLQRERHREEKKKLREDRRKKEQVLRRRRGGHQGISIAEMVNDAKWAQMQEKYVVNIEAKKVEGNDEDGGMLGEDGGIVLHQGGLDSSRGHSSSSSSGSIASKQEKDSDEEEEEKKSEDDSSDDSEGEEDSDTEKHRKQKTRNKKRRKNDHQRQFLSPQDQRKRDRLDRLVERQRERNYMKQNILLRLFRSRQTYNDHTPAGVDVQYLTETLHDNAYFTISYLYDLVFPHSRAHLYHQQLNLKGKTEKEEFNIGTGFDEYTKANSHKSMIEFRSPLFYLERLRCRIEELYEDSALQRTVVYFKRRFHNYVLDASEVQTATSRFKHDALKKLRHVKQDVHDKDFTEGLLNLGEDEMSTDALVRFIKRKRRELRSEIQNLENNIKDAKNSNKSGAHFHEKILKLETRLEYFDLLEQDRVQREAKVKELLQAADHVVREKEREIESMKESWLEDKYYKFINHLQRMKRSGLAILDRVEKPKMATLKLLPPPPKVVSGSLYATEVKAMLKKRVMERQRDVMLNRRLGWIVGKEEALVDQEFTIDDLIVACVAGNYREVLDILDPRMKVDDDDLAELDKVKPISATQIINQMNHDHMTPLYAAMMMVLRRQVVDEIVDLEELIMTTIQKLQRRVRSLILQKGDWKHPRFDLVIMILLFYGADLNYPRCEYGTDGETMLHVACKMGVADVVEWLLQLGVDCNQLTTRDYRIPLMLAVERNHLPTAMILLRYGAVIAVNHQDRLGNTVMHEAARYASVLLTQVLLISGAYIHKRNLEGKLPTEIAQSLNRIEIMTTMQSYRDGTVEHLVRLQFLQSITPDSASWFIQAMGEDFNLQTQSQTLSVDTSWDTVRGHGKRSEPQLMSTSERRVMKIWKPYLKGAKINPAMAGNNLVNPEDIYSAPKVKPNVNNHDDLDNIEGTVPVSETPSRRNANSGESGKTTNSSDYVTTAPRMRRTVLQLSFAKK